MIPFYKANSIGNIIGIIPACDASAKLTKESVQSFCSKGWGVDCDQLMILGSVITIWWMPKVMSLPQNLKPTPGFAK